MDNKVLVINKEDLLKNIDTLKEKINSEIIAVIKGDGYGLGLINMAKVLKEKNITFFAVSEYEEAIKLREAGFLDESILLLTPQYNENKVLNLINNNITLTVDSYENAKLYSSVAKKEEKTVKAHIKVDTGFGRFGFLLENKEEIVKTLKLSNVDFEGIYSHFSCSFEKKYKITKKQFEEFKKIIDYLSGFEFSFKIKHIANSCAALRFKETHLDAVRLGSALLGRLPFNISGLKKIGYMEAIVEVVKELPKNWNIGYANTYKTLKPTKIAVISVGYKDGFMVEKANDTFRLNDILRYILNNLRSFGKKTYVTINDKKSQLVGRVGMYNIVADVTDIDVKEGDKVKLNINPLYVNSNIIRELR